MANIKFSQLPNLANINGAVTIPVVESLTNYTITAGNLQTYITTAAGNITAATVSTTGNITGSYILGNGSQLTGLPATYGNANVVAYLPTFTGNLAAGNISFTGTITGTGSRLSAITAGNIVGTVANAAFATTAGTATTATTAGSAATAATATTAGTVTTGAQPAITSVGTLTSLGVTGNVSVGNLTTAGNITAGQFIGNGSQLTGITSAFSISNGTSNISIPSANGNININPPISATVYTVMNGGTLMTGTTSWTVNGLSSGINGTIDGTGIDWSARANFNTALRVPIYTIASKPTVGIQTGDIIAITDSPTYMGRLAYWSNASATWRYISDDSAV